MLQLVDTMRTTTHVGYDLSLVEKLCRYDSAMVSELVREFVNSIPVAAHAMKMAANQGDKRELARLAHKIKPVLASFGVVEGSELIRDIEAGVKGGQARDDIRKFTDRLDLLIHGIAEDIRVNYL